MIFVGAAADTGDPFPANVDGVIGVGNSDGRHPGTTLSAPATHVMTLLPGNEYDFESGTSVAAAEVTGIVALLLSANNRLTSESIVSLLKSTTTGSVSIDVDAALAKLAAERTGRLAKSSAH
jgi:subtilisin family serine protease